MAQDREALPATSLLLLAVALLLFGIGGGLVGYVVGEGRGEERATALIGLLDARWESGQRQARQRFERAIDEAALRLDRAAADLKSQVSMYHGCGSICSAIAQQFAEQLMSARDAIREVTWTPPAGWQEAPPRSAGLSVEVASGGSASLEAPPRWLLPVLVAILSASAALCFGLACVTLLRLRSEG